MTAEEKLHHLKDWMGCWIDCLVSNIDKYKNIIEFFNETGKLLYSPIEINVIPFEEYLQIIENQNHQHEHN